MINWKYIAPNVSLGRINDEMFNRRDANNCWVIYTYPQNGTTMFRALKASRLPNGDFDAPLGKASSSIVETMRYFNLVEDCIPIYFMNDDDQVVYVNDPEDNCVTELTLVYS